MPKNFSVYTDGSCLGNPGPGGWAFVVYDEQRELFCDKGSVPETTNNRMELLAAIMACEYSSLKGLYKSEEGSAFIYTDSQYVKNGIETWIHSWSKNNWRGSKGEIKNKDLWIRLDALNKHLKPEWKWVKGHSGDIGNERANFLATEASNSIRVSSPDKKIENPKTKIYLKVPFSEKEEAKKMGARWDGQEKKWYVDDKKPGIEKWLK